MHEKVISNNTLKNIEVLVNSNVLKKFYLAGGTGCALQIGHRTSYDLDFFTKKEFNNYQLERKLQNMGRFKTNITEDKTIIGEFNETKISFMQYNYTQLKEFQNYKKIKVASLEDIGCMKMEAISQRGKKRDFIDLYFILKEINLNIDEFYKLYKEKYFNKEYSEIHLFKSLTYFIDAEKDPMPNMFEKISWGDIKNYFLENQLNFEKTTDFGMEF